MKETTVGKRIILELRPEEYDALRRQAEAHDRDAWQQARHIVKAAIAAPERAETEAPRCPQH